MIFGQPFETIHISAHAAFGEGDGFSETTKGKEGSQTEIDG